MTMIVMMMMMRLTFSYFDFLIFNTSCMKKKKKPRLEPKPSLSWPRPTSTAQASDFEGRGRKMSSFTGGFQAEPSRHITILVTRDLVFAEFSVLASTKITYICYIEVVSASRHGHPENGKNRVALVI